MCRLWKLVLLHIKQRYCHFRAESMKLHAVHFTSEFCSFDCF